MKQVTRDELVDFLKECYTKADLCRFLELVPAGGNYKTIDRLLKDWDISWDNYLGQSFLKGKHINSNPPKSLEEICVKNSSYRSTCKLKERLIKSGLKPNHCEVCGFSGKLELHHINGDRTDNRLENLQILCPNCHAETDNYRGRHKESSKIKRKSASELVLSEDDIIERNELRKLKRRRDYRILHNLPEDYERPNPTPKYCVFCGKEIKGKHKNKYCSVECYQEDTKGNRPQLIELIKSFIELGSFLKVGKKYGVSDNAVRKWCKLYGVPIHKEELNDFLKPFMNI